MDYHKYTVNGRLRSSLPLWHVSRFHPDSLGAILQAFAYACVVGAISFLIACLKGGC